MLLASQLSGSSGHSLKLLEIKLLTEGGNPGLVVMVEDSYTKGSVFESLHCKLDGHFSHTFVVEILMFV